MSVRRAFPLLLGSAVCAAVLLCALTPALASPPTLTGKGVKLRAVKPGKRVVELRDVDIRVPGTCKGGSALGPFEADVQIHMVFNTSFAVAPSGAFSGSETVSSEDGKIFGQSFDFSGKFTYTGKIKGAVSEDGRSVTGKFWLKGSGKERLPPYVTGTCWTGWVDWKASR